MRAPCRKPRSTAVGGASAHLPRCSGRAVNGSEQTSPWPRPSRAKQANVRYGEWSLPSATITRVISFNDVLHLGGVDPSRVKMLRHTVKGRQILELWRVDRPLGRVS